MVKLSTPGVYIVRDPTSAMRPILFLATRFGRWDICGCNAKWPKSEM